MNTTIERINAFLATAFERGWNPDDVEIVLLRKALIALQVCADREARDEPTSGRAYFAHVATLATLAIEQAIDEDRDVCEIVYELGDGDRWVIYYHAARATLLHSPNENAIFEQGSYDLTEADSLGALHCAAAYHALVADVYDALGEDSALHAADLGESARNALFNAARSAEGYDLRTKEAFNLPSDALDEIVDAATDELESRAEDCGLVLDRDILEDKIRAELAPQGCALEMTRGGLVTLANGDCEAIPTGYDLADLGIEGEIAEREPGYLVRWTMPGYLDHGEWYYGETWTDALLNYIESEVNQ